MQRQLLLFGLVMIAAAGLWMGWRLLEGGGGVLPGSPPAPQAPRAAEPATAMVEAPGSDTAPEADVGPQVERTSLDSGATWVVEGVALRGWKEAYPDVGVHLLLFAGYEAVGEPLQEVRLKSGANGQFRWPLRPPTTTVTLKAVGDEDGHYFSADTELVVLGTPPPALEVRLYPEDCAVEGVVRDGAGNALAGAAVRTSRDTVQSDENGRYRLVASSVREETYVYATARGHAQSRAIVKLGGPGSVNQADFELSASFRVVGRVVDESGMPLPGARVQTFFTNRNVAETDATGRFVLDHLDPRRQQHSVYARKAGYVEAQTRVEPAGPELEIRDLVLRRGVRVEGRVLNDTGQPLPGVEIYIGFSPAAYNRLDAVSGDDGSFVFPNVPAGDQTMVATHSDFAPDSRVLTLSEEQPVVNGIVIQFTRGHSIGGVARNEAGEPMAGVSLSARHRGEYVGNRTKTDAEGRFRMKGLPADGVDLEFYGTGIVRQNVPVESFDHDDLEVVLRASGRVAGRVVDGRTGEPLKEFAIRFVRADPVEGEPRMGGYSATWAREGHRFADTDGYWDSGTENLTPGAAIGIEAVADGYAPGRLARVVAVAKPDPDAHVLEMFAGARVTGRVLDGGGRPVAAVKLGVRAAADRARYFSDEPYESGTTQSVADGTFALDAVTAGESILLVQASGRPLFVHGPFEIPTEGVVDRLVQLPSGATLVGKLLDAAGAPRSGEMVRIHAHEVEGVSNFSKDAVTGVDGTFECEGLPDGVYQISHRLVDGKHSVYALTVFARIRDGRSDVIVMRPDGGCSVVGTIRRKDGGEVGPRIPVSCHARVDSSVARENAPPGRGAIARDGRFEIHGLRPGDYSLSVNLWGTGRQLHGGAQVTLTSGQQQVDIELVERPRRR